MYFHDEKRYLNIQRRPKWLDRTMQAQTSTAGKVLLLDEAYGLGKDLLGGKGHGLVEMTHAGLPVPPGIIITTKICSEYYENNETIPQSSHTSG